MLQYSSWEGKADESAPLQEEQDQGELRLELEEKRQELRKVILAKISKSQSELLASLTGTLADTLQAPVSMLKAAYNASSSPAGENFDMFL